MGLSGLRQEAIRRSTKSGWAQTDCGPGPSLNQSTEFWLRLMRLPVLRFEPGRRMRHGFLSAGRVDFQIRFGSRMGLGRHVQLVQMGRRFEMIGDCDRRSL